MAIEDWNRPTTAYLLSIGIDIERDDDIAELSSKKEILGHRMLDTIRTASRLRRQQRGKKGIFGSLEIETPKVFRTLPGEHAGIEVGMWLSSEAPADGATLNSALFREAHLIGEPEPMAAVGRGGEVILGYCISKLAVSRQIVAVNGITSAVSRINGAIEC